MRTRARKRAYSPAPIATARRTGILNRRGHHGARSSESATGREPGLSSSRKIRRWGNDAGRPHAERSQPVR